MCEGDCHEAVSSKNYTSQQRGAMARHSGGREKLAHEENFIVPFISMNRRKFLHVGILRTKI